MSTLTGTIEQYWTRRASSYTEVVKKNLADGWDSKWADELIKNFPKTEGRSLKVLDIGTGPGFYAIILASRGYDVTAVDLSEGMLEQAKANAGELAEKIRFLKMDAQTLEFPDNEFDVIVTRNLTWNLPDPVKAYGEWRRVLRDGGVMLNIDSNWYAYLFDEEKRTKSRPSETARCRPESKTTKATTKAGLWKTFRAHCRWVSFRALTGMR